MIGLDNLLSDIVDNNKGSNDYVVNVFRGEYMKRFFMWEIDPYSFSSYLVYANVLNDKINKYRVEIGYYGCWVKSHYPNYSSLYKFQSPDFIQGFITICNAFHSDYRIYMVGLPFKSDTEDNNISYGIEGLNIWCIKTLN